MSVKIDQLAVNSDKRGAVFEPLDAGMILDQRNTHVVISQPGVIRGNHYHLNGTEIIAVMGPALVRIREDQQLSDIEVPDREVYRFILPPGVAHAIKNTSDRLNVLAAFSTVVHDPENPDTIQEILMEG